MAKTKGSFKLILHCQHSVVVDARPNPRKVWPDPQMCPTCNRKKRVCEIYSPLVEVDRLTAPNAPRDYLKALKKGKR